MVMITLAFSACDKEPPLPPNPYDNVDYGDDSTTTQTPDPNSIIGIHQNILQVKCNNPGCHDGTFEPDFRTVQSAWTTLVYHDVVKNDPGETYEFRVTPYDISGSMLYRRLTQDDPQLQQMPATGNWLTAAELQNIQNWISAGAPDMFGNIGSLPNNEPIIVGYLAFDVNDNRIDDVDNRVDSLIYKPFYVDHGVTLKIAILIEDDSTQQSAMQVNQLKFSYDKENFASATTMPAYYIAIPGFDFWLVQLNTNSFVADTTVYMRYYVNDGDHPNNTEFPRNETEDGYKTYWAFKIKP